MVQFPVGETMFVVLEPGNVNRMREGRPLVIKLQPGCKSVGVVVTPDLEEFVFRLKLPCTPEQMQSTLDECHKLPEVVR